MNKKHFIALADFIKDVNNSNCPLFDTAQILGLANFCSEQNPNFNMDRWLSYIEGSCTKNGGKVKQAV